MLVYDKKRNERDEYPWVCPVVAANELMEEQGGKFAEINRDLWEAVYRPENDKKQLADHIASTRQRYVRMEEQLVNNNFAPSSLGEDQGRGARIDQLCALFYRSASDLSKWLEKTYPDRYGEPKVEYVPPVRKVCGRRNRI